MVGYQSSHQVLSYERNVRCAKSDRVFWRDWLAVTSVRPSDDGIDLSISPSMAVEERKIPMFLLVVAVILDVVGILLFFIGIFAPLSFWDFFVLSGPLLIFLSLVFWIFWYLGNLTVSDDELNLIKPDVL